MLTQDYLPVSRSLCQLEIQKKYFSNSPRPALIFANFFLSIPRILSLNF